MAKDRPAVVDVEAGQFSDGDDDDSVEEISEQDFKQFPRSRVWHGDMLQFRNYGSRLYNFAWAQGVHNKPLVEIPAAIPVAADVKEEEGEEASEGGDNNEEGSDCETEKEEGELEEGEIELGAMETDVPSVPHSETLGEKEGVEDIVVEKKDVNLGADVARGAPDTEKKEDFDNEIDFDQHVSSILEELEVTEEDVEKSFIDSCSRLQRTIERLKNPVLENHAPVLDAIIQQAIEGIRVVHSVFLKRKEEYTNAYFRFLSRIKSQGSSLFTSEQMSEIDAMMQTLAPDPVAKEDDRKTCLEPLSASSSGRRNGNDGPLATKFPRLEPLVLPRNRAEFNPLLDPHVNYDENSLPSPTSEKPSTLPLLRPAGSKDSSVTSQPIASKLEEADGPVLHPYVTDALKAVSIYQQKYDRISFLSSNRLPSPTPSEECNDDDGDALGEVSSSSVNDSTKVVISPVPFHSIASSSGSASSDNLVGPRTGPGKGLDELVYASKPVEKPSAKSRDPRLRFSKTDVARAHDINRQPVSGEHRAPGNGLPGGIIMNSRKNKVPNEATFNNHSSKRQRNGHSGSIEMQIASVSSGMLAENGATKALLSDRNYAKERMEVEYGKPEIGESGSSAKQAANTIFGSEQLPTVSTAPTASLPSLLKDIAENPNVLVHLLKEQKRFAAESQQKVVNPAQVARHPPSTNIPVTAVSVANSFSVKTSEPEQRTEGKPQSSLRDAGTLRMKPRDPRRILHNNLNQKSEGLVSGSSPSNNQNSKDFLTIQEIGEQALRNDLPSQSGPLPDITRPFTKKLEKLADILSTTESRNIVSVVPQNLPQSNPSKADNGEGRPVTVDSNIPGSTSLITSEASTVVASQSPNPWGDVDHLLDGYDEQQKAAIQKERARRIEEQNKMFAARKLCLVLDLDHTLLNSAKFTEVDQVHDEILRKKEEQDSGKPQRHLFHFQHMGMWTKLRPGIWNFLEKASKLYELHLYTMGNKLYATEMAKVLDPSGTLFAGRVLSRGDDSDPFDGDEKLPKIKDLDGVLGMESAVVIIDDSVRVWPHNKLNLIVVERYTYFPCSRRQFGLLGPSLLEIDHDERPEDGTLASSLAVIERIHQNFFSHHSLQNLDVRNILAAEQRKILAGCRIVFSRIFPVGEANPHLHPLWQTAEQFGAVCTNQIDDQVTHVVANSLGTDKVNWALSTGRFVVYPGWVEASALLYRRANEQDFAIKL